MEGRRENFEQFSNSDALDYKFWYIIEELKRDYQRLVHDDFPDEVISGAIQGIRNLREVALEIERKERCKEDDTKKRKFEILMQHCAFNYLLYLAMNKENRYRFSWLYDSLTLSE